MIAPIVPYVLAVVAVGTYLLQLWTGVAIVGWPGDQSMLVQRRKRPWQYWFVMLLQTALLVTGLFVIR